MNATLTRILGIVTAVSIVTAGYLAFRLADREDGARFAHIAPPAEDTLVQAVDLKQIASFKYMDDSLLEVTDEDGKRFKMQFTEACPGLRDARDFSLVTAGSGNLDKFNGIAVDGYVCTFKDFSDIRVAP
ncbi:MAG TPA: hypothetical protein P5528_16205 [Steroidobacteraceae bacterium]|nr:hypothetical protein [Steroidobacteraceae bacterium]HRX90984.1 hypothetical protein [Steroidobacteraceae bacterium]